MERLREEEEKEARLETHIKTITNINNDKNISTLKYSNFQVIGRRGRRKRGGKTHKQ